MIKRGLGRSGLAALLALAIGAAVPSGASATVTCTAPTASSLAINMSGGGFGAGNDFPQLSISGTSIVVFDGGVSANIACPGPPTVNSIDEISITQSNSLDGQAVINIPAGGFGPGLTPEAAPGGSEIEIDVDLGGANSFGDFLFISPADTAAGEALDHFRFGTLSPGVEGANLNAPEGGAASADGDDIQMQNVETINTSVGITDTDQNIIDGSGGPEFSGPFLRILNLQGTPGPDVFAGGDLGNNILTGGGTAGGNDLIISGLGTDNVNGGPDIDTISYTRATSGVTVGLVGGSQNTGGAGFDSLSNIENVTGSSFGDSLTGDNSDNAVNGVAGNDTLVLNAGNDTFNALDNGPDTVDCGAGGGDAGTADAVGTDTLIGCENVNFPPETSIVAGPADGGATNDTTPSYTLAAGEPATFAYRTDGGTFLPCPAECEIPALAEGPHQIEFRATDSTALVEQTPLSRTVTVDTTAPNTQIDSGPVDGSTTGATTATYGFSSEAGAGFECSIDGGSFSGCSSPSTLNQLTNGSHTFDVRAVDAAGNADASPARRTLHVDADPPETALKKPKLKGSRVTFKFASDEAGSTFECRLDKKPFKACTSPKTYRKLKDGKHKFFVLATDPAGNEDDKAAKAKFEVG